MARRKTLSAVVAEGEIRVSLEAVRDKLAGELEVAEGRDVASLAKQLAEVLAQIEALPRLEGSRVDDLARRRQNRLPGASVSQLAEGEPVGGRRGNRARG